MSASPPASVALWMPWFIKEHRANASTLSHLEHSALCYLLMLFWEHDGTLPDDDRWLAKQLRLSNKQWCVARVTLLNDCVISGGRISHPKLQAEIVKARRNQAQKSIAGKASAAARKVNGCSTAVPTAVQPRAGKGEGILADRGSFLSEGIDTREDEPTPFDVIKGGKA